MCNNEGFSRGPKLPATVDLKEPRHDENERPKRSRSQANGAGTPPKMDSTAGLDAPILTRPGRLVRYNSCLGVENQHLPAERPMCATTRVSVEDKKSQIDQGSSRSKGLTD